MLEILPADERGSVDFGWLASRHSFSFGAYHNPGQMGFSDLRVINDDRVQPGQGFAMHGHQDMEIFTYVLDGTLEHRDSMGNGSLIRPGEVQVMSAGTGVRHSESNPSATETVHLLQVWIVPDRVGVAPRYQQVQFAEAEKRGCLRLIISPDGTDGSLAVYQDARVYAGLFDGDERATLNLGANRHAYVQIARGSVEVNGRRMHLGDGARLRQVTTIEIAAGRASEVLLFDLRPHELPQS